MATKITYNGKTTELADGHIATLPCKDLRMETDVVIEAPEPVEVPTIEEWDGTGVIIKGLVNLISFTIDGTSYQAEEGMYWEDWVDSVYNTAGFTCNGENSLVYNNAGDKYVVESSRYVEGGYAIINGYAYGLEAEEAKIGTFTHKYTGDNTDSSTFEFEVGMTWREWCESAYNTTSGASEIYITNGVACRGGGSGVYALHLNGVGVYADDLIVADATYTSSFASGGGGSN